MKEGPNIAHIAALIGDPARANMLTALMSGKALTATELAGHAGVTIQTASAHLGKLDQGGLLTYRKQGRHKYFALANPEVAGLLEALMGVAANTGQTRTRTGPKDPELRQARVCYNHLAGDMGVQMFDSLRARDYVTDTLQLTPQGHAFVTALGIDVTSLNPKTPLCRECLDWSARRSHLAGSLGRAFLTQFETLGWAKRASDSRAVRFTANGQTEFARSFPA